MIRTKNAAMQEPGTMKKLNHPQKLNYLAIVFLERLGIDEPTQFQIDLMEFLLSKAAVKHLELAI